MKRKVSSIALNALLLIHGVVTVYPFVWMIFSSFKENQEIMALEQHLLPQKFIIDNYINMNAHFNFVRLFKQYCYYGSDHSDRNLYKYYLWFCTE